MSTPKYPSTVAAALLRICIPAERADEMLDDLVSVSRGHGRVPRLWVKVRFWLHVLSVCLRPSLRTRRSSNTEFISTGPAMIRQHVSHTVRLLRHRPLSHLLNIVGLGIGLAASMLIGMYVSFETGFDTHHENADRLYRVTLDMDSENESKRLAMVGPPVGPALSDQVPGIAQTARFLRSRFSFSRPGQDAASLTSQPMFYADASAFSMFSFEWVDGDPSIALNEPFSVVLTRSVAGQLFKEGEPVLGATLMDDDTEYRVTGLIEDVPEQSHLPFGALVSMSTATTLFPEYVADWWALTADTYALLEVNTTTANLAPGVHAYLQAVLEPADLEAVRMGFEPLADVYLYSGYHSSNALSGNGTTIRVFLGAAILLLMLGVLNFASLAVARMSDRLREVGIRRASGANWRHLTTQFMMEVYVQVGLAVMVSIGLTLAVLESFSRFAGKDLTLDLLANWPVLWIGLAVVAGLGVLAGAYPAWVLSTYNTRRALAGRQLSMSASGWGRKGMVVLQFAICSGLLAATVIVFTQLEHLRTTDPGFDKERLVTIDFRGHPDVRSRVLDVRSAMLSVPGVTAATVSGDIPTTGNLHASLRVRDHEGEWHAAAWRFMSVDDAFVDTYGMRLLAGRSFSSERAEDADEAMLLNEAAAIRLGFADPEEAIGASFQHFGSTGRVVGVLANFNLKSLKEEVEPVYMRWQTDRFRYLTLRLAEGSVVDRMQAIEAAWNEQAPSAAFSYTFVDDAFDALYKAENRFGQVIGLFGGLALIVSILGLFGLAMHMVKRRLREIGIRKVLGASEFQITLELSRDVLLSVGLASALIVPIVWVGANMWLENFAVRTDVGPGPFLLAAFASLAIAAVTIGWQALRAAHRSAVLSLKSE